MTTNLTQRVTVFIHSDVAKHAKTQAIIEDLSLTQIVEKALISYLPEETVIKKHEIKKVVKNGKA